MAFLFSVVCDVSKSGHDNQRLPDKFLNRVKVHFPDTIFRPYLVPWVTRNLYRDKTRINTQILGTRKRAKHGEFVCVVDMNICSYGRPNHVYIYINLLVVVGKIETLGEKSHPFVIVTTLHLNLSSNSFVTTKNCR